MRYVKKQHGFLMIETMLATVIITIALVAVAGMFIQSTQAHANSSNNTAATAIAQHYLELLKVDKIARPHLPKYSETLNGVTYEVTIQESQPFSDNRLLQEIVTVSWLEKGKAVSMQMTTYILRGTIAQFP